MHDSAIKFSYMTRIRVVVGDKEKTTQQQWLLAVNVFIKMANYKLIVDLRRIYPVRLVRLPTSSKTHKSEM